MEAARVVMGGRARGKRAGQGGEERGEGQGGASVTAELGSGSVTSGSDQCPDADHFLRGCLADPLVIHR